VENEERAIARLIKGYKLNGVEVLFCTGSKSTVAPKNGVDI
jgi:hypothetical protein